MKKVILIIITILLLSSIGVTTYFIVKRGLSNTNDTPENVTEQEEIKEEEVVVKEIITYDEKETKEGSGYFEIYPKIGGQQSYICFPKQIEKDNPPTLIIFSHGSNTTVTTNTKDQFMIDLSGYCKYFLPKGYAFAASNMHGVNWGNTDSVNDIKNLRAYILDKYLINEKVNLLAHSMGGLAILNYSFKYPNNVNTLVLLAPTTYDYTKTQFNSIKNIPILLYHGDKDVNIPLSSSTFFKKMYDDSGNKNLTFIILKNKTHWDIDTELKDEIYEFISKYE